MSDDLKELLPPAARAMGLTVVIANRRGRPCANDENAVYWIDHGPGADRSIWMPHLDPGQGAEMEDKLRITVVRWNTKVSALAEATERDPSDHLHSEKYSDHPTEGHARRWASLRVAAAIGRSMK